MATACLPSPGVDLTDQLSEYRSLDGSGNNSEDPQRGAAGTVYPRSAPANYADGIADPVNGPPERYLSNRIFNDTSQNVFSSRGISHWGFVWGQFVDHTIGLRESGDDEMSVAFDESDPLEEFTNDLGPISTTRSAAAAGTGEDATREQVNTVSSFIDAWAVYGGSSSRLDWLREGPLDGDPTNNDATLLNDDGYLPTAALRPDSEVPDVELMGRLMGDPTPAVVAGDVRANENLGLTSVQTLFMREHNRIVADLPDDLDEETKFQIARRVISALEQYITYNEFLPAMGVDLPEYDGYDPDVDPSITNEFATVGYRAHSQIHGEFEAEIPTEEATPEKLEALEEAGVEVQSTEDGAELTVPLNIAFGNPALLKDIGVDNLLAGLASESAYANDEQIDNQLRSVLFQVPGPDVEDPSSCLDGEALPGCFSGVNDLGAFDVLRGRDHGMPTYNDLREAFGLPRVTSFTGLTGEDTDSFANDPEIDQSDPIDDPDILDVMSLTDADGNPIELGSEAAETDAVRAQRRSTVAARLKAIYETPDAVDAFTGMLSEPHVGGTEFGELQLAMWTEQFQALRDGDRYFYLNDPVLAQIKALYGIDYRQSLHDVIVSNSDVDSEELQDNVFVLAGDDVGSQEDPGNADDPGAQDDGAQHDGAQHDGSRDDHGNQRYRGSPDGGGSRDRPASPPGDDPRSQGSVAPDRLPPDRDRAHRVGPTAQVPAAQRGTQES